MSETSGLDTEREDWITKEIRTCAYFTGIQNETCKAGVNRA